MDMKQLYKLFTLYPSVQTDTRKLKKGDIFFALKGPNFNGNKFAKQALESGAAYAVVDEPEYADDDRIILVDDTLKTLQELALHHRKEFNIPFIAITGSNGKTTTKEMVSTVLSSIFRTYTTEGNLNNHIGVPLTILSIKKDAEMAVIEMGANHQKEIESYCTYTLPDYGIITNCGKAHLEGFGGEEGVRKGKGELYMYLLKNNGTAFVMWDYDYLREMSKGISTIIKYGTGNADVNGKVIYAEPFLSVSIEKDPILQRINTQLVGAYNLPNVLVAITVGKHFNIPSEKIKQAIENYAPSNSRSQLVEKNGNKIILDAYNANPTSMRAAIENIASIDSDKKILMLGAMAELGEESVEEHKQIVELIGKYNWTKVALVGGDFLKTDHGYHSFSTATEAAEWFKDQDFSGAYILVKGSRSTAMEKILES
ncbi:MAG: UDP-N-acetylmuramoyl-tripeptide--D-alanyl-D-alanine ligase [Flavitalea sp.]